MTTHRLMSVKSTIQFLKRQYVQKDWLELGKKTDSERILAVQSAKSAFVWQTTCKTRRWVQPSARTKLLTGHPEVRPCSYEAILHVPLSDILQHGTLCAEDVPIGVLQAGCGSSYWKNTF